MGSHFKILLLLFCFTFVLSCLSLEMSETEEKPLTSEEKLFTSEEQIGRKDGCPCQEDRKAIMTFCCSLFISFCLGFVWRHLVGLYYSRNTGSEISKKQTERVLSKLLEEGGIPVKSRTVRAYVDTIQKCSPWLFKEELLNISQWNHHGEDLKRIEKKSPGTLPVGTLPLWTFISCLLSPKPSVQTMVEEGEDIMIQVKEKVSQVSQTEKESVKQKKPSGGKVQQETATNTFLSPEGVSVQPTAPPLQETATNTFLSPEGESVQPTAPPPYAGRPPTPTVDSWDPETRSQILTCPVFEAGGQRFYQVLNFKTVKQLKEAVTTYGPQAPFTVSLVESINNLNMTPADWANMCKAVLNGGQYLLWKVANEEFCKETARRNAAAGYP
ncbi:endogenous retrovirus group K member 8 Gag polyprotein-like [Marmota monax]|uniref:endogenous retrovirus group K member 8 Gag polyprotein-like n=1 Tax=Marmota monax TaxID=9995 RepID=UPI0026EB2E82|nr:endogenous retrovirus group K member 8 Gag polyprotein-like [Marmota monax]XP_058429696.1 endogenous retrovirus group K member 8 Gag polyprotein-like [Marmota monax]